MTNNDATNSLFTLSHNYFTPNKFELSCSERKETVASMSWKNESGRLKQHSSQ